jgi:hypothetical protein
VQNTVRAPGPAAASGASVDVVAGTPVALLIAALRASIDHDYADLPDSSTAPAANAL